MSYISFRSVRFIPFLLLFICLIELGCSNQSSRKADSRSYTDYREQIDPVEFDLEDIKKRGSLRIILENTSTGYFLYKGRPMGLQYELSRRFCEEMGLTLEVVIENDLEIGAQPIVRDVGHAAVPLFSIIRSGCG